MTLKRRVVVYPRLLFFSSIKTVTETSEFLAEAASKSKDNGMSPGVAAVVSVVGTLAFAVVVVAIFSKCKKKRNGSREQLLRSVDRYQQMPGRLEENTQ